MLRIGENLNVMKKDIGAALKARDPQPIQDLAKAEADAGVDYIDLNLGPARKKGADPLADTIFFLTDGQPTAGRITDAHQILEEITRRNSVLGVKIHAVGVSKEQNAGFLLNLAKRNHGQYVGHK